MCCSHPETMEVWLPAMSTKQMARLGFGAVRSPRSAAGTPTSAEKGERTHEFRSMHVYDIVNGRITAFWNLAGDSYAEDEFFLG